MKKVSIRGYGKNAYMRLENNRWLRVGGIVAIVDLDRSTVSPVTKKFVLKKEKEGLVTTASLGLPKSFVLYDDGRKEQVYLSLFSCDVLRNRAEETPREAVDANPEPVEQKNAKEDF